MPEERTLITWTHIIYALHAFSLITGIIGAATVVGAFLTGWPSNHTSAGRSAPSGSGCCG